MVLYFSATGNTKFVAEELAACLGDSALNLLDRVRKKNYSPIHSELPFVICSPVIVCEIPRFLYAYLQKATFTGSRELYLVMTSGGYAGISSRQGKMLALRKNMRYMGCAELTMPRNYIASNAYSELAQAEIEQRIRSTAERLPAVVPCIQSGKRLKSRHVWLFELLITLPVNPIWSRVKQGTRDFRVTDACISCGICERCCPVNAIHRNEGRPVWSGKSCAHCMACIQNCPVRAIEYGDITEKKQRYRFEKYQYAANSSALAGRIHGQGANQNQIQRVDTKVDQKCREIGAGEIINIPDDRKGGRAAQAGREAEHGINP